MWAALLGGVVLGVLGTVMVQAAGKLWRARYDWRTDPRLNGDR